MFDALPPSKMSQALPTGYYVRGYKATKNEYYFALALEHEKIDFMFRVYYWGGRHLLGGLELDFLCFTPLPQPVQVFGEYWHTGVFAMKGEDRLNLAMLERIYNRPVIIVWGEESDTYEKALETVHRKLE